MSEWINWSGGECPGADEVPMPVAPGTLVDVRYHDGEERFGLKAGVFESGTRDASPEFWRYLERQNDIIAYRVVSAPKEERETAIDPLLAQAAIAAMQGLLASGHWEEQTVEAIAGASVQQADALLSALKGKE